MNFTILLGLIIILAGIFFRILPYEHIQGLWNDEYMSWFISQKPLFVPFLKGILSQCHMPFYYIYLKIVTSIFGNSDFILRLSSSIISFLSIFVMFYIGKEKSKTVAYLCAFFTAISGFLIYYSYEVRPYSLIFLFSALSLLYSIRLLNNTTKKNLILYLISNFLIVFTHTIGFIYVLCSLLFVGHFLNKKSKNFTKLTFLTTGIIFLAMTPILIKIFTTISFSQWWSSFSFSKICFLFTDFFSSYLINLITAPNNFFGVIGWSFLIFAIIPATIALIGIINAIFVEKNYTKSLSLVAFTAITVLFIASLFGKVVFISKYNIEIYPILIYLSMLGLSSINNKKLKIGLITIFFITNIFHLFSPDFKEKFNKTESNKLVASLLTNARLRNGDTILFTYYPKDRFEKYFDFSKYKTAEITKGNFNYFMTPNTTYEMAVKNSKTIYKPVFLSNNNETFDKVFNREVLKNLEQGDKIAIIFLNSVEIFSDVQLFTISTNEKAYEKTPQMFLIFSYIKNKVLKTATKQFKFLRYEQNGDWAIATFEKL